MHDHGRLVSFCSCVRIGTFYSSTTPTFTSEVFKCFNRNRTSRQAITFMFSAETHGKAKIDTLYEFDHTSIRHLYYLKKIAAQSRARRWAAITDLNRGCASPWVRGYFSYAIAGT